MNLNLFRCRVDFQDAQTSNSFVHINVIGKPIIYNLQSSNVILPGFHFQCCQIQWQSQMEKGERGIAMSVLIGRTIASASHARLLVVGYTSHTNFQHVYQLNPCFSTFLSRMWMLTIFVITLLTIISGSPSPGVRWLRNGTLLDSKFTRSVHLVFKKAR